MNQKFQNKYRIPSVRAPWWDYGANAAYFITICTRNREHYFGKMIQNTMHLTEIGKQAEMCWNAIPEHFPFVILDEFVVMPNHIHGILVFDKSNAMVAVVETQNFASLQTDQTNPTNQTDPTNPTNPINPINPTDPTNQINPTNPINPIDPTNPTDPTNQINPTNPIDSPDPGIPNNPPSTKNKFGPQSQNLGSVVRGFKIGVTKFTNNNNLEFGWQPRFHDHIIRNEAEFQRIKHYIATNPQNWDNDKFKN
mgnify:FL=1